MQRAALGIAADDVAFLFFGRLSFHAKAHPLPMFLALEQARRRTGKRVQLILAGWFANPTIEAQFLAGAEKYCPSVRVSVVDGRRPDVRDQVWYAADVFTSLSDNIQETFGLTPLEAMAAGLPVVVSDWNGYRETVRHGVDGFLVPTAMPRAGLGEEFANRFAARADTYDRYIARFSQCTSVDVAACIEHYVALIERPALRASLGAAARARVQEAFGWPLVIRQYQQLWRELAARRAQAPPHALARGAIAHPLRDDPLAAFAHYATRTLDHASRVRLASADAASRLEGRYRDPLLNYAGENGLLATLDECQALLAAIGGDAVCAGDLLESFPDARRAAVARSIGWLLKIDLLTLVRDQPPP
jgi:hypothetical protein